jgi:hypothetical protein
VSNSLGSNPLQPPKPSFAAPANSGGNKPQSAPPGKTDFVALSLRPVSTIFSEHFADHLLGLENKAPSEPALEADCGTPTTATESGGISPLSPDFVSVRDVRDEISRPMTVTSGKSSSDGSQQDVISALQAQMFGAKGDWQRHVWELESQIRGLKAEIGRCGRSIIRGDIAKLAVEVGKKEVASAITELEGPPITVTVLVIDPGRTARRTLRGEVVWIWGSAAPTTFPRIWFGTTIWISFLAVCFLRCSSFSLTCL